MVVNSLLIVILSDFAISLPRYSPGLKRWLAISTFSNADFFVRTRFLLRDAMHKRGPSCRPVSVRPSRSYIVSKCVKNIVKPFPWPDSSIILVSWGCLMLPNFKGNRSTGR